MNSSGNSMKSFSDRMSSSGNRMNSFSGRMNSSSDEMNSSSGRMTCVFGGFTSLYNREQKKNSVCCNLYKGQCVGRGILNNLLKRPL